MASARLPRSARKPLILRFNTKCRGPRPKIHDETITHGDMADREGFEPSVRLKTHNGLAVRRFKPLTHLSVAEDTIRTIRNCQWRSSEESPSCQPTLQDRPSGGSIGDRDLLPSEVTIHAPDLAIDRSGISGQKQKYVRIIPCTRIHTICRTIALNCQLSSRRILDSTIP